MAPAYSLQMAAPRIHTPSHVLDSSTTSTSRLKSLPRDGQAPKASIPQSSTCLTRTPRCFRNVLRILLHLIRTLHGTRKAYAGGGSASTNISFSTETQSPRTFSAAVQVPDPSRPTPLPLADCKVLPASDDIPLSPPSLGRSCPTSNAGRAAVACSWRQAMPAAASMIHILLYITYPRLMPTPIRCYLTQKHSSNISTRLHLFGDVCPCPYLGPLPSLYHPRPCAPHIKQTNAPAFVPKYEVLRTQRSVQASTS